jgi:type IV pilus assembly protein PilE
MTLPIRRKQGAEGFTLIELMIVVVIIAVLVTVAVIAYTRHIKKTRMVKEKVFVSKIQALQETYFQQHGNYLNVTGEGGFYPSTLPTGDPVPFAPTTASPCTCPNVCCWGLLGARPESGHTYLQWRVAAAVPTTSTPPTLPGPTSSSAEVVGIQAGVPWYYIWARGDLQGDGPPHTAIYANSVKTDIWTQNEGD